MEIERLSGQALLKLHLRKSSISLHTGNELVSRCREVTAQLLADKNGAKTNPHILGQLYFQNQFEHWDWNVVCLEQLHTNLCCYAIRSYTYSYTDFTKLMLYVLTLTWGYDFLFFSLEAPGSPPCEGPSHTYRKRNPLCGIKEKKLESCTETKPKEKYNTQRWACTPTNKTRPNGKVKIVHPWNTECWSTKHHWTVVLENLFYSHLNT